MDAGIWARLRASNGFRIEGELHRYNDFGEDDGLVDGNVHAWAAMLNGFMISTVAAALSCTGVGVLARLA